jgi:hypothetical protein
MDEPDEVCECGLTQVRGVNIEAVNRTKRNLAATVIFRPEGAYCGRCFYLFKRRVG